jgi:quinol-cytochrome oxidoreductase complex cytochrome b subunit
MILAFGNGIYMAVQAIYVFFIYPWSNSNSDTKTKFKDIFQSLIPYMLIIFYFQICLYGYSDLGPSGGAGIMFIVLVSIVLQLMKHSS